MSRIIGLMCVMTVTLMVGVRPAQAQPQPPRGFQPPPFPLMEALDTDKDGKLSKQEIENAIASLTTLDKDKNGTLSQEEIGWPPFGGFGRPGGRPDRPGGAAGGSEPAEPDPDALKRRQILRDAVALMRKHDQNEDGKLDKEEWTKSDKPVAKADADSDDKISLQELINWLKKSRAP